MLVYLIYLLFMPLGYRAEFAEVSMPRVKAELFAVEPKKGSRRQKPKKRKFQRR